MEETNMKILIPLDGTKESEAALPFVKNLVSEVLWEKSRFEVTLLRVLPELSPFTVPPVYYNEQDLRAKTTETLAYLNATGEFLEAAGVTVEAKTVVGRDNAEEIVAVAESGEYDLIAMATHGRSGIAGWALGNVAAKVMNLNSTIPVATVRANAKWEASVPLVTVQTPERIEARIPVASA
jgi:nucleotide-binding universal stress UspA family protein